MLILGEGTKRTQERKPYFREGLGKQRCRNTQRGESLTFLDRGMEAVYLTSLFWLRRPSSGARLGR